MARPEYHDDLPHLRTGEAIGPGLRRVARECCRAAVQRGARLPTDDAVHEARRALKRARAALRLEEKLGVAGARAARRRLAAIARELSPRRDATVAAHLARRLEEKSDRWKPKEPVMTPKCIPVNGDADWWRTWQRKLAAEERRLARGVRGAPSAGDVRRVLHHFAKRVCQRAKTAAARRNIVCTHEWRKAVIVLREQLHVVRPFLGDDEARVCGELHRLARRLGKATDYHVLKRALESGGPTRGARRRVDGEATARRGQAMRKARKMWPKVRRALRKGF